MIAEQPVQPKLLYKPREAAALMSMCESTLTKLVRSGAIKTIRDENCPRLVLFPHAELVAYIEKTAK